MLRLKDLKEENRRLMNQNKLLLSNIQNNPSSNLDEMLKLKYDKKDLEQEINI